jgi:prepilin peptidase CpaA
MHSIPWWPTVAVLFVASIIDVLTRRIPNWLVLPFLISGLVVRSLAVGLPSLGTGLAGIGLACLLFGIPCLLRGMGMGDLKLAAGVGAWIGPDQLFLAFIVTGIVGGVFATLYALWRGSLGRCLDGTSDLLAQFASFRIRPHEQITLGNSDALSIPYAPAIAIGTLFSFFAR